MTVVYKEFIYKDTISDKARKDYAMLVSYLSTHKLAGVGLTLDLTTHECSTDRKIITLGYKVTEVFNISILDALLHEIYHNILPRLPEYDNYSQEQINLCEDLEINSKLRLDREDMNVVHPSKMGLTVGLKTLEYLRILFPEQENPFPNFNQPQLGDHFLEKSTPCKEVHGDHSKKQVEGHREGETLEIGKGFVAALESKPDPLRDAEIIAFLEEAKAKAQTYMLSSQIQKTYSKLSRRSHDPRIITPGTIETLADPYQMGRMPVLLLDNSSSMYKQIPLANSIMDYVHSEFCIMLYSDQPGWKFYPWDRNIEFVPSGGTSIYKSAVQIIEEDGDAVGDFYIITDGDDSTIKTAANYVRDLGREFHVLRIQKGEPTKRLNI